MEVLAGTRLAPQRAEPGRARLLVRARRQPPDARHPRRRCRDCWHSNWEVSGASGRWLEGSAPYRWTACAAGPEDRFSCCTVVQTSTAVELRADCRIDWSRICHALELDAETPRDLAAEASIFGSARTPVGDPGIRARRAGGARRSRRRRHPVRRRQTRRRGRAPRDVSAAPGELPVTLVPPAGDTISGT